MTLSVVRVPATLDGREKGRKTEPEGQRCGRRAFGESSERTTNIEHVAIRNRAGQTATQLGLAREHRAVRVARGRATRVGASDVAQTVSDRRKRISEIWEAELRWVQQRRLQFEHAL